MSQHSQIHQAILDAGYTLGHKTGQVQYYVRGNDKVQLFHPGLWKRTPDRVAVVTSFAVPGVAPRPDKWTQFDASNAAALDTFLKLIAPQPAAVPTALPSQGSAPTMVATDEEIALIEGRLS